MSIDSPSTAKSIVDFKISSMNVPTLMLSSTDLAEVGLALQQKLAQAPSLFKYSSLLIDLKSLQKQSTNIDIAELIALLQRLHFLPIGLYGGSETQNAIALKLGVPCPALHAVTQVSAKPRPDMVDSETEAVAETEPLTIVENRVITAPVRSGQRIYVRGDLTILAAVNPGAEVMAEGNIHVYAPLRGRALAGVRGNIHSCIFCSNLQAELVSIAGTYQLSEALKPHSTAKLVQIYLQGQSLLIKEL